ncbi:MAG: aminotransferase class I/II-fold pyridoxal phosphate-dependent enzyme [Saprospiraceae bacterium]|nr:aminotransferase class I/II-fold pyridoxal phosphate-dependent enzyme [Saprospiraceae bacterium]
MKSLKIREIDFLPSRTALFDGEEYLFFSGTSYLGIGHQGEFRAALMEGIDRYGTVFSASRNNNLRLKIYEEAESFIAHWTGAAQALTVTSGLLAGQLAVNFLKNSQNDKALKPAFIYAPSAHPAVWEAPPSTVFQNRADFEKQIIKTVKKGKNAPIVIVSNAVDMLKCETFDFSWIKKLPDNQDITLLVDDSHGIGVTGENGSGIFKGLKKLTRPNVKIIVIASLAKALGIPGGVILSEEKIITAIRNNPLFVGASPIIPAYLYAFLNTQALYDKARQTLAHNIELFTSLLAEVQHNLLLNKNPKKGKLSLDDLNPFRTPMLNYPVFYTPKNDLFDHLFANKIFISHFAYPQPTDPPITRVVLSALHTEKDMTHLVDKIIEFYPKPINSRLKV